MLIFNILGLFHNFDLQNLKLGLSAKFLSHDYHSLQNRTLVGQSRHTAS